MRFACINYLEAVLAKVPDAMSYLSMATRPAARFEKPRTEAYVPRLRKRPFARFAYKDELLMAQNIRTANGRQTIKINRLGPSNTARQRPP